MQEIFPPEIHLSVVERSAECRHRVNKKFYSASEMSGSLCAHCGTAQQHFPENLINVKIRKNLLTKSPNPKNFQIISKMGSKFRAIRDRLLLFPGRTFVASLDRRPPAFPPSPSSHLSQLSTFNKICSIHSHKFKPHILTNVFHILQLLCRCIIFIGLRYTWGPIYGSECL